MPEMPFADARVHSDLATARLWRRLQVDRFLQRGVRFNVDVDGGMLDGVSAGMHARSCIVGSDMNSGIVLFDDGVAEKHAEMHFKSSIFGPVMSVRALGPNVRVNDQTLDPGKTTTFDALPQTVYINDVALVIEPQHASPRPENSLAVQTWRHGRHPALAVLLLLIVVKLFDHGNFDFQIALNPEELPYDVVQRQTADTERLEVVATSVQAKLAELGLEDYVSAALHTSGAVDLTGTLRSDKEEAWKEFQYWYDQSAAPVLLSRVTMAPDLSGFPAIASVKLTEPRMINLLNGTQLNIGDVIHDNVRLKAINNGSLILDAQGEDLEISFSGGELRGG